MITEHSVRAPLASSTLRWEGAVLDPARIEAVACNSALPNTNVHGRCPATHSKMMRIVQQYPARYASCHRVIVIEM